MSIYARIFIVLSEHPDSLVCAENNNCSCLLSGAQNIASRFKTKVKTICNVNNHVST
jgi:hypothetical protein